MQPESVKCADNRGRQFVIDRASEDAEIPRKNRYNRFKPGHPAGFVEAFANHYYDLADSLGEFKESGSWSSPWVFTLEDAEEGLIMLEAIADSSRRKAWQAVKINQ
jgi:hypothetical protein